MGCQGFRIRVEAWELRCTVESLGFGDLLFHDACFPCCGFGCCRFARFCLVWGLLDGRQ